MIEIPILDYQRVQEIYHNGTVKFYPTYKGNAKARRDKMKRRRQKRGW